jgi:DNA processing protein
VKPETSPPDLRDPRTRDWLALQCAWAWRPQLAWKTLEAEHDDPARALQALGARPRARELEQAAQALSRADARLVPKTHAHYPVGLLRLADPPPVLFVRGDSAALCAPMVAFVGARAASVSGLAVARRLARELASAGVAIVSGLARGIDAAAHEGALEAGQRTIAVQACGPDRVYPAAHRGLARRIAAAGAVITELPPGAAPRRVHFPLRNRLISGLALAVVVVEARERSGTLITARHALDQGIDVFVVPGSIDAPTCRGSNRLLRDGAWPLLEVSDLLEGIGRPGLPVPTPPAPVAPELRSVLAELRRAPASRDDLARALGRPVEALASKLLALELEGRIAEDRDGRFRVVQT